jgi:ubiquinone biosynthesis protein
MVMSLLNEDYESLCYEYAEVASAESSVDMDGFQREVRNSLSPHMGLALSQLNVGKILIEATQVAVKFNMKIPGDWMLVFKAILTIEGMGRSLDPEFDLLSMGQSLVKDLVKNQYSMQRITKEVVWIAKDLAALLKVLPRQIRWMFKKFNRNDFALEIKSPQLELIRNQLDINAKRTSLALLTVGFFIASSMVMLQKTQDFPSVRHQIWNYPAGSVLFFGLGCFSLIAFLYNLRR